MRVALWALLAIYAVSRILQVFPGGAPMLLVVALHVFPPALFGIAHGRLVYGWRGIVTFFGICLVVGNAFENLSIRTGFPFGHYVFTELMGPKILAVPILLGVAYLGMAYLSWTLARLILGDARSPLTGSRLLTVPLIAAFVMTAWDFSMDPVWSTVLHAWTWFHGGAYFGVPVSNFLGWYLTAFVFYLLFALWWRGRELHNDCLFAGFWKIAVVFYGVSAAGNLVLSIPRNTDVVVTDPAGVAWRVSDVTGTCALVSIFVMGAFARSP